MNFLFNEAATTEIYTYLHTLSLHDALPISAIAKPKPSPSAPTRFSAGTRQSSKVTCAVGEAFQPSFFSGAPNDRPGVSFSTTRQLMPFDFSSLVRTMQT